MQTIKKLIFLLSPEEQKHSFYLLLMIIIMALLDMIGVASILPFMAVLSNPEVIESNIYINYIFISSKNIGIDNNQEFLFFLGVLTFSLLIISLIFKTITTYFQLLFVQMREYSIGKRLVEGYLHQPYSWFLNRHSADLGKNILSEVEQIISNGLSPLMELIAKGLITIAIIILLLIVDIKLSVLVGLSLGGTYFIIFYLIRKFLNTIGEKRSIHNQLRFTSVSEAFGAIKEVKIGRLEQTYINKFKNSAAIYARSLAFAKVIAHIPRNILEAIAFGGILLIILFLLSQSGNFSDILPIISLYVFAGYRLLPAMQQFYAASTQLTFIGPAVDRLYKDLKNISIPTIKNLNENTIISPKHTIKLNSIFYNYPDSSKTALKDISINIPVKSTVGIIGPTGSGKTTTIDIILGLLESQKGTLEVDEQIITNANVKSWQQIIGYVPQNIYLSDDTISSNIAFGQEEKFIDKEKVQKVAKIASIHDFIMNDLPAQYQTRIGERGIRLSGGQRQRIGIARALYHSPEILILDEATSSLDNETEKAVMEAVNNLSNSLTIIIIAHRLNTVSKCDLIFKLHRGQLIQQGSFKEVVNAY